jgi:hypothetical protein
MCHALTINELAFLRRLFVNQFDVFGVSFLAEQGLCRTFVVAGIETLLRALDFIFRGNDEKTERPDIGPF